MKLLLTGRREEESDQEGQLLPCRSGTTTTEETPSATTGLSATTGISDFNSGSGKGDPQMTESTIARQIRLLPINNPQPIASGRFGQVYRGKWHGNTVACKIFDSHDER